MPLISGNLRPAANLSDAEKLRAELRRKPLEEFELLDFFRICRHFEASDEFHQTRKCSVSVLNSYTIESIRPIIKGLGYLENINIDLTFGPYNQFEQILLDPEQGPRFSNSDFLILAIQIHDLFQNGLDEKEAKERLTQIIQMAVERCSGITLVTNFVVPTADEFGILGASLESSERNVVLKLNQLLNGMATKISNLFILDVESIAAGYGKRAWFDYRQWYGSRTPISGAPSYLLASLIVRFVKAKLGDVIKCIVVDCDNTLWGGIVGEDGLAGIAICDTYPGNCYRDFQGYLLRLYERGILLAINSKNNPEDVDEVLERRGEMVLKRQHFTVIKASWKDKVSSLMEIAEELNIGLDSIVFVDDSLHEVKVVNEMLPEVRTFLVPSDPSRILDDFRATIHCDTLAFSQEDRNRPQMYQAQIARKRLQSQAESLADFYQKLEMKAKIFRVDDLTLPRISQLTQRTNQFNLTTMRYSEPEIRALDQSEGGAVYAVSLSDRFGDSGLVGVLALRHQDSEALIDTFLMSCRVIGRTLEQTMIAFAGDWARRRGASRLVGEYVPSNKNGLVANFYKDVGFRLGEENQSKWYFNLDEEISYSKWIELTVDQT